MCIEHFVLNCVCCRDGEEWQPSFEPFLHCSGKNTNVTTEMSTFVQKCGRKGLIGAGRAGSPQHREVAVCVYTPPSSAIFSRLIGLHLHSAALIHKKPSRVYERERRCTGAPPPRPAIVPGSPCTVCGWMCLGGVGCCVSWEEEGERTWCRLCLGSAALSPH